MGKRRGGALRLIGWAHFPRTAAEVFEMLGDTTDEELIELMKRGGPAGRIAWAEYGKRRWNIEFGLEDRNPEPKHANDLADWT
jgi:hypothetical protein